MLAVGGSAEIPGAVVLAATAAARIARLASENDAVTPHVREMARLRGIAKAQIERDPRGEAQRAAAAYRTVVVLKGDETWIAGPDGACNRNRTGSVGLATSGSGDMLSGIVTGLAARELLAELPVLLREQEGRRR